MFYTWGYEMKNTDLTNLTKEFIDAAKRGQTDKVQTLLDKNKDIVTLMDGAKMSALDHACSNGHIDVVQILIKAGANVSSITPDTKPPYTPAHWAAAGGHPEVLRLLATHGATVDKNLEDRARNQNAKNQLNADKKEKAELYEQSYNAKLQDTPKPIISNTHKNNQELPNIKLNKTKKSEIQKILEAGRENKKRKDYKKNEQIQRG
jgi:ankyrin repeat protein